LEVKIKDISTNVKFLTEIKNLLIDKYKMEYYLYEQRMIKIFIKDRCDNYKDNQRKMINSITEKEIKSISINKV
jgi:hypothetical protein